MPHTITPEERNILLENPELVMFDPYRAMKTHRVSLGKALIPPLLMGLLMFLWGVLCPGFIKAHPRLFAGVGCAGLILASGSLPVLYLLIDDRAFRKAKEEHYALQLRQLLPEHIVCRIAHVQWVTYEKAEGGWILDGREEMFGYVSYENVFRIEPDTDLAVISGGDSFMAFVRRDERTECYYSFNIL